MRSQSLKGNWRQQAVANPAKMPTEVCVWIYIIYIYIYIYYFYMTCPKDVASGERWVGDGFADSVAIHLGGEGCLLTEMEALRLDNVSVYVNA